MITARVLPGEEWWKLADIFAENGAELPERDLARIAVEEDDGKAVSFLTAQMAMHLEPLWQHPDYRGRLSFRRLLRLAEEQVSGKYYAFAPDDHVGRIMQASGLRKLPWTVWHKER